MSCAKKNMSRTENSIMFVSMLLRPFDGVVVLVGRSDASAEVPCTTFWRTLVEIRLEGEMSGALDLNSGTPLHPRGRWK